MPRIARVALIGTLLITWTLVIVRLSEYPVYFAQPHAMTHVIRLFAVSLGYLTIILFSGRLKGLIFNTGVFRIGLICGCASGLLEIVTIAAENGLFPIAVPPAIGILSIFVSWGLAGFWAKLILKSSKSGLLASVASAGLCMLIGVAGGSAVEMFIAPANPALIANWQEFRRSSWADPTAFQIANTLDSAFDHLLLAPIVATIVGAIGVGLARLFSTADARSSL